MLLDLLYFWVLGINTKMTLHQLLMRGTKDLQTIIAKGVGIRDLVLSQYRNKYAKWSKPRSIRLSVLRPSKLNIAWSRIPSFEVPHSTSGTVSIWP